MLEELKNELQITWFDSDLEDRLERYLREGQAYLKGIAGFDVDCTSDYVKPLLFAYCRYAYFHTLETFKANYHHDLVTLRWKVAIERYESKPTD